MPKYQVTKKQVLEWTENPVTLVLKDLVVAECLSIAETPPSDCLVSGDPFKTMENVVELEARERIWKSWEAFLEGHWEYFEEYDDDSNADEE